MERPRHNLRVGKDMEPSSLRGTDRPQLQTEAKLTVVHTLAFY